MAFASLGPVTAAHTGPTTNTTLNLTTTVGEGSILVLAAGHDSNIFTINDFYDSSGINGYDWTVATSSSGAAACGWGYVEDPLSVSLDDVFLEWSGSSDAMARCYAFNGLGASEVVSGTKAYTEGTSYSFSLNNTSGDDAVMLAVFCFPFDYGVSATPSGWTKFADITDTADSQLLGFYKEIGTGVNTCTEAAGATVAYLAAGVILPYATPTVPKRSQVIAMF